MPLQTAVIVVVKSSRRGSLVSVTGRSGLTLIRWTAVMPSSGGIASKYGRAVSVTVWTAAVVCSTSSGITVVSFSSNVGRAVSVMLCKTFAARPPKRG